LTATHRKKALLINFWATWCGLCTAEFPEIQKTWRMYRRCPFELATVAIDFPDEEEGVRRSLVEQHASTRNLLFATMDSYESMKAFDPQWDGGVPTPGKRAALQTAAKRGLRVCHLPRVKSGQGTGALPLAMDSSESAVTTLIVTES
jgi:hypothetical protein